MLRYDQMNQVSQDKIENAIVYVKDAPKGFAKPEAKELAISADGIEFKVVLKIAAKLSAIWKEYYQQKDTGTFYDPNEALKHAWQNEGYIHDGSGVYNTMPLENQIPENTPALSAEQVETRAKLFVTVACMCAQPDIAAQILNIMPRKKNKTLHKGRKKDIAFLNIVDQRGWTYQLVAKNADDTCLCIELRNKVPVVSSLISFPDDLLSQSEIFFQSEVKKSGRRMKK